MTLPPILRSCQLRPPASAAQVKEAERVLSFELPADYKELLLQTNGLEGFVSPTSYLLLWSIADVPELNEGYAVADFLPGVVLLGTDGGDTGYGFARREGAVQYVSVPLVGMGPEVVSVMGSTFEEVVERLSRSPP
jgi:hypothetical protein